MICINNINIDFGLHSIIRDGTIHLYNGEITVLSGESGSGKTSLLNIIGLLDRDSKYDYFDESGITINELYRINRISYVFQEYNLIEDLTVDELFHTIFNATGKKYNKNTVLSLLQIVDLSESQLKQKSKSLSGGEKQRLAIALALIKNPAILLLDEPAASLDELNSKKIADILVQLKQKGMMIVIATHHESLYNADHVYRIENNRIEEVYHNHINSVDFPIVNMNKNKFHYIPYVMNHMLNHIVLYSSLLLIIIFSFSYILFVNSIYDYQNKQTQLILDSMNKNEIVVCNTAGDFDNGIYYSNEAAKFSEEQIQLMKNISNVKNVIPYIVLSGENQFVDVNGNNPYSSLGDCFKDISQIHYEDKTICLYDHNSNLLYTSCNANEINQRCLMIDENVHQGIYISNNLASMLGIKQLDHTTLSLKIPVIIGNVRMESATLMSGVNYYWNETDGKYYTEDGIQADTLESYNYVCYPELQEIEIKGIYEQNVSYNRYDHYQGERIFMDYQDIEMIHKNILLNDAVMVGFNLFYDSIEGDKSYTTDLFSSTMIIQCDDTSDVQYVSSQINNKLEQVEINVVDSQMDHFAINSTLIVRTIIIALIVLFAFVLIQFYMNYTRKKEYAILKVYGVKYLFKLPVYEWIFMLIVSFPFIYYLTTMIGKVSVKSIQLNYNFSCGIVHEIMIIVVSISIGITSILALAKIDPIKELRGK